MKKIVLALIHNNNKERYSYIRSHLDLLKKDLTSWETEIVEVSKQPEIVPSKTMITLVRKFLLWKINREWIRYKLLKPRNIILDTGILFWRLVGIVVYGELEKRRLVIDSFVTDKHIRALSYFLDKDADLLICFEDDAVFKKDSLSRLKILLKEVEKQGKSPLYMDLAGGCSLEVLKVSRLETKKDKDRRYYKKPVTNSGCCYMINSKTAELFMLAILRYPCLRLIPYDWLMNKLFILTSNYKYNCFHYWPHIFEHGSSLGDYKSWL